MTRRCPTVVFLLLAAPVLLAACASTPPSRPDDVCAIFSEKRGWYKDARRAESKWGSSMHIPLAIMFQESGFRAKVRPPRSRVLWIIPWRRPSSAYGFAQALNGTWRDYIDATGEYWRERHDFGDATDFIHWYNREARRRNGVAEGDAYSLYLNYHEGFAGYARGSYKGKDWLLRTASAVQQRSERYANQYSACEQELKKGFWARLFGW